MSKETLDQVQYKENVPPPPSLLNQRGVGTPPPLKEVRTDPGECRTWDSPKRAKFSFFFAFLTFFWQSAQNGCFGGAIFFGPALCAGSKISHQDRASSGRCPPPMNRGGGGWTTPFPASIFKPALKVASRRTRCKIKSVFWLRIILWELSLKFFSKIFRNGSQKIVLHFHPVVRLDFHSRNPI